MIPDSLYAENIKLAADVKRKENNGLMTVRTLAFQSSNLYVFGVFQMNSKCLMKCDEHVN